jgi:hypothetical protein
MTNSNKGELMRYLPFLKKVYYPGSGRDLETLSFILSELKFVEDIIYCDYKEHLELEEFSSVPDCEVLKVIPLNPYDFNKNDWAEFWFNHENSQQYAEPGQKVSNLFILHNIKTHKIVRFYQLGTEGVGTYEALISFRLKPNLIILADHDFGCNWNPNIWGEPETDSGKISFLKQLARNNRFILVDKTSTNPWSDYQNILFINNTRWNLYSKIRTI